MRRVRKRRGEKVEVVRFNVAEHSRFRYGIVCWERERETAGKKEQVHSLQARTFAGLRNRMDRHDSSCCMRMRIDDDDDVDDVRSGVEWSGVE